MLKHLTFVDVERASWLSAQESTLALAREFGLVSCYASEESGHARFSLRFAQLAGLKEFVHHAGPMARVGRMWPLELEVIEQLGVLEGASFVGETTSWVKDSGRSTWLESHRLWLRTMERVPGFVGSYLGRGRRTFVSASFWRDEAAHFAFERDVVPHLRAQTRGDQVTARLTRFAGTIEPSLLVMRPDPGKGPG